MCYNYIIALISSSSNTATAATIGGAIGGAVGGAVLLVSSLCIVAWCVRRHKRKLKKKFRSNQPHFKPSLRVYAGNPRYIYEIENTEATMGVEARMSK